MTTALGPFETPGPEPAADLRVYLDQVVSGYRAAWPDDSSFEARLAWQRLLNAGGWATPGWPTEFGGRGLGAYGLLGRRTPRSAVSTRSAGRRRWRPARPR